MKEYAFNARATYAMKSDQIYRIYPDKDTLYFIRIFGQPLAVGVAAGLEAQLGKLGKSLGAGLIRRSKQKIQNASKMADLKDYRRLIHSKKHSFALSVMKILSSSIDPPEIISGHGHHEGIWRLSFTDGKKMKLQFEDILDMKKAIAYLPEIIRERLQVNVARKY